VQSRAVSTVRTASKRWNFVVDSVGVGVEVGGRITVTAGPFWYHGRSSDAGRRNRQEGATGGDPEPYPRGDPRQLGQR
jgi:hypothetical protein